MKKETAYGAGFVVANILVAIMDRFVGPHILTYWNRALEGEPLPGGTLLAIKFSGIWPLVFLALFLVVTVISTKNQRIAYNGLMILALVEVLFISMIATAYMLLFLTIFAQFRLFSLVDRLENSTLR